MKKKLAFIVALSLLASGCAVKSSSDVVNENAGNSHIDTESDEVSETETKEPVVYRSLIQKYVGELGTEYKAYDEIIRWDGHYDTVACMCPAQDWLDSEGKLVLPFDAEEILKNGMTSYAYFYVPDEVAVKATTGELADICLLYAPMCNMGLVTLDIEPDFEFFIRKSNALEESLRRDDFAYAYFERYMEKSENIPAYYEGMEDDEYSAGHNRITTLNAIELILAQSEAYEQLTEEQRITLVKRVIGREKNGNQGAFFYTNPGESYTLYFLSCITGEKYISGYTGECVWETNPWVKAVNEMELTEVERRVVDKYLNSGEED